ncbi:helix-turn-helix domain-containing protein [Schwartzia sp. (in: firmicutes)]
MNQYVTGELIKRLREKNHYTQAELAERINVSDKAVSKWETGRGYPDITLLEPLAAALRVSVAELLSGAAVTNHNAAGNMTKSVFYVCPVCGNILYGMGEASVSCHGVQLMPSVAEISDGSHECTAERVEDEYFVQIHHEMTKQHYISFIAAVYTDRIQLVKLYPEGNAQARFTAGGVKELYYYCNRDGLFKVRMDKK